MTRRERQGSIVVLVIVALLMAGTMAMSRCRHVSPELQHSDIRQFEFEADTSLLVPPYTPPDKHKKSKHEKKSRKRQPKEPKPAKQPRHVDPVPQF